jgi:uncharacterized membrane protein YphA (DoxX/SURF4 family)
MESEMKEILRSLQKTQASNTAFAVRTMLGILFLMTGIMKFAVPVLRLAFSGQLDAAGIPFHSLNMWVVPATEVAIGVFFTVGLFSRLASVVAIMTMLVATYVHLVAHDPTLFPLQPEAPIIPIIVIVLSLYVLWKGSGSRSIDLGGTKLLQIIEGNLGVGVSDLDSSLLSLGPRSGEEQHGD